MHLTDWNVYRQQVTAGVGGFPYSRVQDRWCLRTSH
jgi:hypothetical protein